MNSKVYKVLKAILDEPTCWHPIPALAYDYNMTCRQISSVVCAYEWLPLEKDRDNELSRSYVKFGGSPEDAEKALAEITSEYYNISEDMKKAVMDSLSSVAWMSVSDIMDDTCYNRCDVVRTLGLLEGVTTKTNGVLVLYKRDPPEVS